ncbi:MAG: hypothetical protein AYK18_17420 [Theionarchaea archaeon DG-70]|nr:MAG: hypothetical protein AYK18_17420 [Theionarchaea archaeon DG-70]
MPEQRKIDNFSMKVWLETTENTVGSGGLKSVLNYAHLQKYIDDIPPDNDHQVVELPPKSLCVVPLLECSKLSWSGSQDILTRLKKLSAEPWDILLMFFELQRTEKRNK